MKRHWIHILTVPVLAVFILANYGIAFSDDKHDEKPDDKHPPLTKIDKQINQQAQQTLADGRQIFRFDTFGDEDFWGGTLKLHRAIKGEQFGAEWARV